jgi:hypothetical protein
MKEHDKSEVVPHVMYSDVLKKAQMIYQRHPKAVMWIGATLFVWIFLNVVPISGVVVDQAGKPIKDAAILVYWEATPDRPVQTTTSCYGATGAVTNENGRFFIPRLGQNSIAHLIYGRRQLSVAYPGMTKAPTGDEGFGFRLVMQPLSGTREQQFAVVSYSNLGGGCGGDGAKRIPFIKAKLRDLERLAVSEEEKERVDQFIAAIKYIERGGAMEPLVVPPAVAAPDRPRDLKETR